MRTFFLQARSRVAYDSETKMLKKLTVGVIGKDGRTSAIEKALRSNARVRVVHMSEWKGKPAQDALQEVLRAARTDRPDFVVVGPEEPLEYGVVNELHKIGVPSVGPTKSLARLESSKAFTRELVREYGISGNPEYQVFKSSSSVLKEIRQYLDHLVDEKGGFVIKPDGLTGGKGVKVSDVHLFSTDEAVAYCQETLAAQHSAVIVEEKLEGEEFSFQSFSDGFHVKHMVVVQDHKRAGEGDSGPNTGGMGSYTCPDHSLPFLRSEHIEQAKSINAAVVDALYKKTGERYKGILYGGFMVTQDGIRLIEYNARFGDPEALNVLSILKTDFAEICEAIVTGTLGRLTVEFEHLATVCKYVVPLGYPDSQIKGDLIDLSAVSSNQGGRLERYFAAVNERDDGVYLTGSRAVAFVGIGKDLEEAENIAETAASAVRGPVFHRRDIGTNALIQHRINHMREVESRSVHPDRQCGS